VCRRAEAAAPVSLYHNDLYAEHWAGGGGSRSSSSAAAGPVHDGPHAPFAPASVHHAILPARAPARPVPSFYPPASARRETLPSRVSLEQPLEGRAPAIARRASAHAPGWPPAAAALQPLAEPEDGGASPRAPPTPRLAHHSADAATPLARRSAAWHEPGRAGHVRAAHVAGHQGQRPPGNGARPATAPGGGGAPGGSGLGLGLGSTSAGPPRPPSPCARVQAQVALSQQKRLLRMQVRAWRPPRGICD
jgi:hypothetical protein